MAKRRGGAAFLRDMERQRTELAARLGEVEVEDRVARGTDAHILGASRAMEDTTQARIDGLRRHAERGSPRAERAYLRCVRDRAHATLLERRLAEEKRECSYDE